MTHTIISTDLRTGKRTQKSVLYFRRRKKLIVRWVWEKRLELPVGYNLD